MEVGPSGTARETTGVPPKGDAGREGRLPEAGGRGARRGRTEHGARSFCVSARLSVFAATPPFWGRPATVPEGQYKTAGPGWVGVHIGERGAWSERMDAPPTAPRTALRGRASLVDMDGNRPPARVLYYSGMWPLCVETSDTRPLRRSRWMTMADSRRTRRRVEAVRRENDSFPRVRLAAVVWPWPTSCDRGGEVSTCVARTVPSRVYGQQPLDSVGTRVR